MIKIIKGMKDYIPSDVFVYQYIEKKFRKIINSYSFNEVRFPILENSNLYNKNINKNNLLFKYMYSFNDKNNLNISLRPEGTMSCIRMYLENKLFNFYNFNKLWYIGPMFRYEKPQKGRLRQFYQIGLEIFGNIDTGSDLELILIINRLLKELNINNLFILEINSIGNLNDRIKYIKNLNILLNRNDYFIKKKKIKKLDFDLFKKLDKNNIDYINLMKNFPKITDFINDRSVYNFNYLCELLSKFNINFKINKNLFRGLDYYNDIVFEWKYKFWSSQNTICAGGRYDYLIKNLYDIYIPSVGLAIGLDRLALILKENNILSNLNKKIDIYIISYFNYKTISLGFNIVEDILNSDLYFLNIYHNYFKYTKLSKIIIKVLKLNCRLLIIIGKREFNKKVITIKDLYLNNQFSISVNKNIVNFISNLLKIN